MYLFIILIRNSNPNCSSIANFLHSLFSNILPTDETSKLLIFSPQCLLKENVQIKINGMDLKSIRPVNRIECILLLWNSDAGRVE